MFAKVCFSFGGVSIFHCKGNIPEFFLVGFMNYGKISISAYSNASFLRFWDFFCLFSNICVLFLIDFRSPYGGHNVFREKA